MFTFGTIDKHVVLNDANMNRYLKKYRKLAVVCLLISLTTICCLAKAQIAEPVYGKPTKIFTHYTTSWIGNDGGYEQVHIPHDMLNIYVRPDGVVATICGWDEGGTNVGVFKDGKLISRPEGSGTGGWGRFSGKAVVLDDRYVYQLLTQNGCDGRNSNLNQNGLPQFPPCDKAYEWKTIRRYDYSTGMGAPFSEGFGYKGDMLVVCSEQKRDLTGLAITKDELFVAVTGIPETNMPDSIKVYTKKNMKFSRGYNMEEGVGLIYADDKGGIWMLRQNRIIRFRQDNGIQLPQMVSIPEDVTAVSFSVDVKNGRLLVANRAKDLNVLIYTDIYTKPALNNFFGVKEGVMGCTNGYLQGQAGSLRFSGPCGVGTDNHGNIYVANTFIGGGRGASLESYEEKSGKQQWKQEGLIFTATADFDRTIPDLFYSPEKIHKIDLNKRGSRLDELLAYTVNPFLFPNDERCRPDGPFITSVFKRTIHGESFLFVSDMYGGMLAGYRFDKEHNGYIGIPFMTVCNGNMDQGRPITFWLDQNGDGVCQDNEFRNCKEINQYSMSFFVDLNGNIWRGTRGQGFMLWKTENNNKEGIPQYAESLKFTLPENMSDAKRIYYDPEKDELFLAGFSPSFQDQKDTWWAMGSTIAKCSHFMDKIKNGYTGSVTWNPDLLLYLPFHIEDGSGKDQMNAKAFTVAGDCIFVLLAREGIITVYNRNDGKFMGCLRPGENVQRQSGWCDFNYAINAVQNLDGSYDILVEENGFGKIIHYHLVDFQTENVVL